MQIPRVGMFATVRNRRAVIAGVEPYDHEGRLHLVQLEYKDDQWPQGESLIWEREFLESGGRTVGAALVEPTALPNVSGSGPMPAEDFDALVRASRWTAAMPYLDPDGTGPVQRLPISSPFHGAVQVEDFQLVPLLKALRMPRVNLLIADDVGLGKTIEAGLIVTELLLRRRIQRVLILTPASLRSQWQEEMWSKFALDFEMIDRGETHALRKRLGMDANPWRSHSRIIASYHYLRQPDVLEQFIAACHTPHDSPHLPWDLLIVDECHNLMPSAFGDDSDLCKALRLIAPQFEHRLFLSATPHNGHTRCFTGLLEMLDPVRFSQSDEMKPAERARQSEVVVRRLKREINERTNPPKFCTRNAPQAQALALTPKEVALSAAFAEFRKKMRSLVSSADGRKRLAGTFAVEILNKRLLSCPTAFADSWHRCKQGLAEAQAATAAEVAAAVRVARQETGDDRELEAREATAAAVVGSWLKDFVPDLDHEIARIDTALRDLGFDLATADVVGQTPKVDARFEKLCGLIDQLLRNNSKWRDDERLIVFTEYKTTLDYIVRRLKERYEDERILTLFGGGKDGMDENERTAVKRAFNNPAASVRILIATDAAAEGLNLQETARYLLHFDCPWNPSRLEQRNGRVDRHGQARDVTIFHFVSDQDHDLQFLAHVLKKAHDIREDLGSANELFDEAAHRRLVEGESIGSVQGDLDKGLTLALGRAAMDADNTTSTGQDGKDAQHQLDALAAELDLDPKSLRDTLEAAMAIRAGRPQLDCSDITHTCKVLNPSLPGWAEVIDDSLRRETTSGATGAVAKLAFDLDPFLDNIGGRYVYRPKPDVLLMHLSHPLMQRGLGLLTRRRFPGTGEEVSRWAVRKGAVPTGADAVVRLTVEELAVNDLRETFHHWVRTVSFPVNAGTLGDPMTAEAPLKQRGSTPTTSASDHTRAADVCDDVEVALKTFVTSHAGALTTGLQEQLTKSGTEARKQEEERYRSRQAEVSTLIAEQTLQKLERELDKLREQKQQGLLFDEARQFDELDRSMAEKQAEIERRKAHYTEVREQLEKERERILKHLLPKRHAMSTPAQVFPVSIEVILPGGVA